MPGPSRPDPAEILAPARRRVAIALRWLALPLAAFCVIAPSWSVWSEHQRVATRIPTQATVLEAKVVNASRMESEFDLYVRYRVRGRPVETNMTALSTFGLGKGDTIKVLVDPVTGDPEDDDSALSWIMLAWGVAIALFFWLVGFRAMGKMLRRDRIAREGQSRQECGLPTSRSASAGRRR